MVKEGSVVMLPLVSVPVPVLTAPPFMVSEAIVSLKLLRLNVPPLIVTAAVSAI